MTTGRIDLHAHSDFSDGTDSPAALVRLAHRRGLGVVALTDHDTAGGWGLAAQAAEEVGVALLRGIEVSCSYRGAGVHLLGYLPDPTYPPLAHELRRVLDARVSRIPEILERLRGLGVGIDIDDVRRAAGETAAMGRPHVADALVALGVVANRDEAFRRYLGPRAGAYVRRYAADLVTMVGTLRAAGGVPVLAHPWADRHDHSALDGAGFRELAAAGLSGIEVDHPEHGPRARAGLRSIARSLDLLTTGSSDYHGAGKPGVELGCNTTEPEQYERLLAESSVRRDVITGGSPDDQM